MSLRDEMWEAELGRYLASLRPGSPESKKWQARNAGYLAVCPKCPHAEQKSEGEDTTWANTLNLRSNWETLRREAGLSAAPPEAKSKLAVDSSTLQFRATELDGESVVEMGSGMGGVVIAKFPGGLGELRARRYAKFMTDAHREDKDGRR